MASAEQEQWQEICDAFRAQLARTLPLMPAMMPDELLNMANAIDAAMQNEVRATYFDDEIAARQREAQFGG